MYTNIRLSVYVQHGLFGTTCRKVFKATPQQGQDGPRDQAVSNETPSTHPPETFYMVRNPTTSGTKPAEPHIMGFTSHQGPLVSRAGVAVSSYIFGVVIVLGPLAAASLTGGPCRVVSPVADLKRCLFKKEIIM